MRCAVGHIPVRDRGMDAADRRAVTRSPPATSAAGSRTRSPRTPTGRCRRSPCWGTMERYSQCIYEFYINVGSTDIRCLNWFFLHDYLLKK